MPIGLDLSLGMLRRRARPRRARSATRRRSPSPTGVADGVVCGFALRNFTDLAGCLSRDGARAAPGGRVALLEVGAPEGRLARAGFGVWFNHAVPAIGGVVSDRAAYRYLPASVAYLPAPDELRDELVAAGFSGVNRHLLSGGLSQLLHRDAHRPAPVTIARARRTEVERPRRPTDRDALLRVAARERRRCTRPTSSSLARLRRGDEVELPGGGLADPTAPSAVARALDVDRARRRRPDPGAPASSRSGRLPFDPQRPASLVVPSAAVRLGARRRPRLGHPGRTSDRERGATAWRRGARRRGALPLAARPTPIVESLAERPSAEAFAARGRTLRRERLRAGEVAQGRPREERRRALRRARSTPRRLRPRCTPRPRVRPLRLPGGPRAVRRRQPRAHRRDRRRRGDRAPARGHRARSRRRRSDDEQIAWLLASSKNLAEHAAVVEDIVAAARPAVRRASHAAEAPSIVRLSTYARLGTWIDGKLRGPLDAPSAIAALAALHPTPAVGGVPRDVALAIIGELEAAPRGLWAGAVGWVDADGTSTWTLATPRGVAGRRRSLRGLGRARGSWPTPSPHDERDETGGKLASVLRALAALSVGAAPRAGGDRPARDEQERLDARSRSTSWTCPAPGR